MPLLAGASPTKGGSPFAAAHVCQALDFATKQAALTSADPGKKRMQHEDPVLLAGNHKHKKLVRTGFRA